MQETGVRNGAYGADKFGFKNLAGVHWNLSAAPLYEHAIRNGEATIVAGGALCAETGHHTGRSPKDKHTVVDALTENTVWWDGNRKQSKEHFDNLLADFLAHAKGKTLFAQDLYGGADAKYRIKARVFTEYAWKASHRRQAHDEAGAEHARLAVRSRRAGAVLDPDRAAMRIDDLLGDRQPQSGILTEALVRSIGVEALEDLFAHVVAHARPVVVDIDFDLIAQPPAGDAHRAAGRRERTRVLDQIIDDLAEP